jgi:uroporphyrinogen decarboxylase
MLPDGAFEAASARWIREVISSLEVKVPVILFSKGGYGRLDQLVSTGANVLSVDWTQSLASVRRALPKQVGVQGNLDPFLLTTTPEIVAAEASRILAEMRGVKKEGLEGHVFNLGHGVPKEAKLECIAALVETVRSES